MNRDYPMIQQAWDELWNLWGTLQNEALEIQTQYTECPKWRRRKKRKLMEKWENTLERLHDARTSYLTVKSIMFPEG